MRVWSVPMRTRFRGITVREGVLLPGRLPSGEPAWGEWSPFLEYSPEVAEPWLRCAEEAAAGDWPDPVRSSVPVNLGVNPSLTITAMAEHAMAALPAKTK